MKHHHPLVAEVHDAACDHLDALRKYFIDPVTMTVIVRNLADPSGERDVVVTDDTLDGIGEALTRARIREARHAELERAEDLLDRMVDDGLLERR